MTKTLNSFISRIPHTTIIDAGRILGLVGYVLDRRHRRIVRRNLLFAYPRLTPSRTTALSRRIFQSMAVTFLEICQLSFSSRDDLLKSVGIKGVQNLTTAVKNPTGAIMMTAHLGNWEMAANAGCCFLEKPLVAVARPLQNKTLDRWIKRMRTRFGNRILDKNRALSKMARALREGHMLGILIDQSTTRSEGVEVLFFNKTVTATPAASILARRYGCPVVPCFCIRETDGNLTLIIEPPLELVKTADATADLIVNTQIMTNAVEKAVRTYPDQWLWFHKRWKRHYPQLYPEDMARRIKRREKRRACLKNRSATKAKT